MKVLIVDDDPDLLFVLEHFLKKGGYDVISATDGAECLEKVNSEKPKAVILDIMMPDMSGWDVCRQIKQKNPNIPISMCSVLGDPNHVKWSLEFAGADQHITKPLSFEKVLNAVKGLVVGSSVLEEKVGVERLEVPPL